MFESDTKFPVKYSFAPDADGEMIVVDQFQLYDYLRRDQLENSESPFHLTSSRICVVVAVVVAAAAAAAAVVVAGTQGSVHDKN